MAQIDWNLLQQPNLVGNFLAGQEVGQRQRKDRERRNALSGYATDPEGAAGALIASGDELGFDLQRDNRQQARAAREEEAAKVKAKAEVLTRVATGLKGVKPGSRMAALQNSAPLFQQSGIDPSAFSRLTEEQLTDEALDVFTGQIAEEVKGVVMAPGSQLRNPKTGALLADVPDRPSYQRLGPNDTLLQVGGQQEASPAASAPADGSIPRNQRNNNPGNIEDGEFARSLPGYKGSDGRFAIFDSPQAGQQGQIKLLGSYGKRGINTVEGIINRWAPPSDNNPTPAYVKFVADKIGVAPGQKLDMTDTVVLSDIAAAIQQFEGGGQSASNAAPPLPGGARVIAQGAPKPSTQTLTPDEVLAAGFLPGTVVQRKPDGTLDAVQSPNNSASPRKAEADLRKEFNARPEVKEYREISNAYKNIQSAAKSPSAAKDLALIFSYMKMLDPTSVVREGEFATAQNAVGIPDRVRNQYNRALNGQRMNPKQRAEFVASAGQVYQTRKARFDEISSEYRSYAADYGVDPNRVVTAGQEPGGGTKKPAGWSKGLPEPQRQAALKFRNGSGQGGTARNPYVPTSETEYANLPSGAHYIHPNGQIKVKP